MRIRKSALVGFILLSCGKDPVSADTSTAESRSKNWSIEVGLYRTDPSPEFKALDDLGILVMQETAKGFIARSVVTRNSFHPGATVCMLVDQRLGNAAEEKARIVEALRSIELDGPTVSLAVSDNSTCMDQN